VHCAPQPFGPTEGYPISVGIDFGRTPAAEFFQCIHGQYRFFDELVAVQLGARAFGKEIKRLLNGKYSDFDVDKITGDPAGQYPGEVDDETPFDVLASAGVPAEPADTNDVLVRREVMKLQLQTMDHMGGPGILISPRCKMLRKGLAGKFNYRRIKVSGDERFEEKPNKNAWSHSVEAAEYGLLGAGEGDVVLSPTPRSRSATSRFKIKRAAYRGHQA